MLWYLANGSLNEYLKSQVLLQSEYYSGRQATLVDAEYSIDQGAAYFNQLTLANFEELSAPLLLSIEKVTAQLAKIPSKRLNSQSIQTKTTTIVTIDKLLLSNVKLWSETTLSGEENLQLVANNISMQLAHDFPALYPQISAKIYAQLHPELNEKLLRDKQAIEQAPELNPAVMQAKKAKQQKRLLGKAQYRIIISSVIIEDAAFTQFNQGQSTTKHFNNIDIGSFGGELGLDSKQLGGELLSAIINRLLSLNKEQNKLTKQIREK